MCGRDVDSSAIGASTEYEGTRYHFCAPACLQAFEANPGHYVGGTADARAEASKRGAHHHAGSKGHGCE